MATKYVVEQEKMNLLTGDLFWERVCAPASFRKASLHMEGLKARAVNRGEGNVFRVKEATPPTAKAGKVMSNPKIYKTIVSNAESHDFRCPRTNRLIGCANKEAENNYKARFSAKRDGGIVLKGFTRFDDAVYAAHVLAKIHGYKRA